MIKHLDTCKIYKGRMETMTEAEVIKNHAHSFLFYSILFWALFVKPYHV